MNPWHDIAEAKITPEKFLAVIEISRGSRNKYEICKDTGMLILDRVLQTATRYPTNYGFIPRTLSEDGDALDVMVLGSKSVQPLALVECRPIAVIEMIDNGEVDEKILAVPLYKGSASSKYNDVSDIPEHVVREIIHFLEHYKDLDNRNKVEIRLIKGCSDAINIIKAAKELYKKKFQ